MPRSLTAQLGQELRSARGRLWPTPRFAVALVACSLLAATIAPAAPRASALGEAEATPLDAGSSAARARIVGPATIVLGRRVTFVGRGYPPGERAELSLAPTLNRGGNCCGYTLPHGARVRPDGSVTFRFRVPRNYLNGPRAVRFVDGQSVDVIIFSRTARALRAVRYRTGGS